MSDPTLAPRTPAAPAFPPADASLPDGIRALTRLARRYPPDVRADLLDQALDDRILTVVFERVPVVAPTGGGDPAEAWRGDGADAFPVELLADARDDAPPPLPHEIVEAPEAPEADLAGWEGAAADGAPCHDHDAPSAGTFTAPVVPRETVRGWMLSVVDGEGWTVGPLTPGDYRRLREGEAIAVRDTWREDEDLLYVADGRAAPRAPEVYRLRAEAPSPGATPEERMARALRYWGGPGWPVRTWAVGPELEAEAAADAAAAGEPMGFLEMTNRQTCTFYLEPARLAWLQERAAAAAMRQVGPVHYETFI